MIAIWEFYFFANILEFITWTAQHSFTSTSRIFELSMPPLALKEVLDFTTWQVFLDYKGGQNGQIPQFLEIFFVKNTVSEINGKSTTFSRTRVLETRVPH